MCNIAVEFNRTSCIVERKYVFNLFKAKKEYSTVYDVTGIVNSVSISFMYSEIKSLMTLSFRRIVTMSPRDVTVNF